MTEFEGVVPALGEALSKRGYDVLTSVQQAVLAPELKDADALVSAQTGSGKTVAFGLALAPTLLDGAAKFARAKAPLALAVAPTRELALQVKRELEWLYEMTGAKVTSCVGGMDMRTERQALSRGAHIVVGTPGRLRDHIERGSFDTSALRAVVLDEADEMLDLGFRDDLEYILDAAPADRRTLMFSATVPRSIATLAKRYQRDAVRVATKEEEKQHLDIEYRALTVAPNDRENAIINVLRYFDAKNALVFCATRATVNHMTSRFNNRGFSVVALSGELSQAQRSHALQAMRDGRARVCIATDVAARGIDLPGLELVVHADIPKTAETLKHRSGRTGRAGRKGVSAVIVPHNARKRTERLLRNADVEANWAKPPSAEDVAAKDRERILENPSLSEALNDEEKAFAAELLSRHSAEHVAAAFLRQHQSDNPAPEELLDSGPGPVGRDRDRDRGGRERKSRKDGDFDNGIWFSLSVGRKHSAEPRWLLPMLCRAGHITKREIGAIRIHGDESHVEISPEGVDKFLEAIGPSKKMEKTVSVTRLEGVPEAPKEDGKKPFKKRGYKGDKPDDGRAKIAKNWDGADDDKPRGKPKPGGKKPYAKKPAGDKPYAKKPFKKSEDKPETKEPARIKGKLFGKFEGKPGGKADGKPGKPGKKKAYKSTFSKPADKGGTATLKRKKPKKKT